MILSGTKNKIVDWKKWMTEWHQWLHNPTKLDSTVSGALGSWFNLAGDFTFAEFDA